MKKSTKLLVCVCALVIAFTLVASVHAVDKETQYSISNLAANGGVLWSNATVSKLQVYKGGYIKPNNCSGHMTVRIYNTDSTTLKVMDYMNVYSTTVERQTPFYAAYSNDAFLCRMKFSNDTTTSIVSSGMWGVTLSSNVINN